MTTPPAIGLVLDCQDPARLAEFWATALDYVNVGDAGSYTALFPNGRPGPKLLLQQVPEPKQTKNRMHLDIETPTSKPKPSDSNDSAPPGYRPTRSASTAPPGSS
jgi:hypothetical protein